MGGRRTDPTPKRPAATVQTARPLPGLVTRTVSPDLRAWTSAWAWIDRVENREEARLPRPKWSGQIERFLGIFSAGSKPMKDKTGAALPAPPGPQPPKLVCLACPQAGAQTARLLPISSPP